MSGIELFDLLAAKGWRRKAFAQKIGISLRTLTRWHGAAEVPTYAALLAQALPVIPPPVRADQVPAE